MKLNKLILGGLLMLMVLSIYLSLRGNASVVIANKYAMQISTLQTVQAKTNQDIQTLLALQLASQASWININDNSNQALAVLLAVQSMKTLPTIEAAQVLQANLHTQTIVQFQHSGSVLSSAFSPDGKLVAIGGADHTVRLWDIASGKEIMRVIHAAAVQSVAFSPDGRDLASASADGAIQIWNIVNGSEVARMTHIGPKLSIVYSPNGKYIASSSLDRTAHVWNTVTGEEVAGFLHGDAVTSIAFNPDNNHIGTGSADNVARVWNIATGKEITRATHAGPVTVVAFSSDGKYAISGGEDGRVYVWDSLRGENNIVSLSYDTSAGGCPASVTSISFSPDGKYVAVGCKESIAIPTFLYLKDAIVIRLWEISSDGWKYRYAPEILLKSSVASITFSSDSKYLLSSSEDRTARVWDIRSGREISRMTHDDAITSIAFSPDGRWGVSTSLDGVVRVWETFSWRERFHASNVGFVSEIAFSPDGKFIASGGLDGFISIQELATGREVASMKLEEERPAFDQSANSQIWWKSQGKKNCVNSIAFSPDGKFIVSGSLDNTVRIWDAATGEEIARMTPDYQIIITPDGKTYYISGVNSVAFSPDGKYVASGGTDGNVYIWDINEKTEFARMTLMSKNDRGPYTYYDTLAVAFSPDGKYIASGNADNTVHVWDIENGQEIARPSLSGGEEFSPPGVYSVAFSPNGRYLVWGGGVFVHVWDVVEKRETLIMNHDHLQYSSENGTYSLEDYGVSSLGTVYSTAFSRDGKYILSAGGDNTVRIWDAITGQEISRMVHYTYSYSSESVKSVAISPDGKYVASSDASGRINLWLWLPDDLIADACSRLFRNLTREEWALYIGDLRPYQAVCPNLPIAGEGKTQP